LRTERGRSYGLVINLKTAAACGSRHRMSPLCQILEEQDRAIYGMREHEMEPPAGSRPEGHGPENISRRP
jgi:hypothetical protein